MEGLKDEGLDEKLVVVKLVENEEGERQRDWSAGIVKRNWIGEQIRFPGCGSWWL